MDKIQTSETMGIGILLALSGGFMDAYSYMCRGKVFANAQTGNMLLFGVNLAAGEWKHALRYALPVLAFAAGIAIADLIRHRNHDKGMLHWRQVIVCFEALILLMVAYIPLSYNLVANSLTSFACGMQVESFRKIQGNGIATTMCIGNLRSAVHNLGDYVAQRDNKKLKTSILYCGIIFSFIVGAVLGNCIVNLWSIRAIIVCPMLLCISFVVMFSESYIDIFAKTRNT